jgi:hypothetical protein
MDFACSHINILHPLTGLQQPDPEALAQKINFSQNWKRKSTPRPEPAQSIPSFVTVPAAWPTRNTANPTGTVALN